MRVNIYIPAEGRIIASTLPSLPGIGSLVTARDRAFRVTAVQDGQDPAVVTLESSDPRRARQGATGPGREEAQLGSSQR